MEEGLGCWFSGKPRRRGRARKERGPDGAHPSGKALVPDLLIEIPINLR